MLASTLLATSVQRAIGLVVAWVVIVGFVVYLLINIRRSRPEVGSETELAANRKPYYDDEELEGPRLDRFLGMALVLLAVIGVGLPLYWLAEPGRQADAVAAFEETFAYRGQGLYNENCASCHGPGATGGVASYILQDRDGNFVASVAWKAPALNTALLRYDREDIQYVLDHGRAFSPMAPWSTVGGGAMTSQMIDNLIDYMAYVALSPVEAQSEVAEGLAQMREQYPDATDGELLFNLLTAEGTYSCARCHTAGWSYERPGPTGGGAFGPKLWDVDFKFNDLDQLSDFLAQGCAEGQLYGRQSQCKSGQMPGYAQMFTPEQIDAVAEYVATLDGTQRFDPDPQPGQEAQGQ